MHVFLFKKKKKISHKMAVFAKQERIEYLHDIFHWANAKGLAWRKLLIVFQGILKN